MNISGSWCPNCHDEAPFLAELYKKYRGKGLEIVTLSFEEADQLANPTRLRAFIANYGIDYTVLLAGEPDQARGEAAAGGEPQRVSDDVRARPRRPRARRARRLPEPGQRRVLHARPSAR